jgi:urea transport system ATP-binding protein
VSERLLYVENLCVSFDGFKALDISYFGLNEKELRVVIGPNGAGKTTFMDVLCGKTKPDTGKALLRERDLLQMDEKGIVDAGVGRKFQTPSVFGSLTVFENLLLARKADRGIFRSLFGTLAGADRDKLVAISEIVGLKNELERSAGLLSHGQKQWLEIGMLLVMEPELMLIDEPAAGMTDEETHKTGELLKSLSKERSVIVIEHDMEFVRQLGSLVTVLCEGKLLTEGTMEKVQNDPAVIEQYLGRAREKKKEEGRGINGKGGALG